MHDCIVNYFDSDLISHAFDFQAKQKIKLEILFHKFTQF